MTRPIVFGEIEGIKEGHWFKDRREMLDSSFHRNRIAGIDGNASDGAAAIVISGGYEDDEDLGDEILYTGAGGNDTNTGKQIKDQTWEKGNAGLRLNMQQGLPVRVIRGADHNSAFSPIAGYEYAGLYNVVSADLIDGVSGFKICQFRLKKLGTTTIILPKSEPLKISEEETVRKQINGFRIVRDTQMAQRIKRLYKNVCQACGMAVQTKSGSYSEGAHIKPLGGKHKGHDSSDNVICLCPNHHVMFDTGAFSIQDNHEFIGNLTGKLILDKTHTINPKNLAYHRKHHQYP